MTTSSNGSAPCSLTHGTESDGHDDWLEIVREVAPEAKRTKISSAGQTSSRGRGERLPRQEQLERCGPQRYGPFVLERSQSSVEVFLSDRDAVVARFRDFFLAVWKGETHMDAVNLLAAEMRRYRGENPVPVGILMVVAERAALPSASVRAQMAHHMCRPKEEIRASALVYEGAGFRAAAIRAVVTGINLVTNAAYPHRVFDSVSLAADWMSGLGGAPWRGCAGNLSDVVASLR